VSLRAAIALMYSEYTKLPTMNPNCYLTAAAQYANLRVRRTFGDSMDIGGVSRQTRRLKFLECVLRVAWPTGHARFRRVYDGVGPAWAKWISAHRGVATVTFLAFVPLEWAAIAMSFALRIRIRP
jgi:hypothetical protein